MHTYASNRNNAYIISFKENKNIQRGLNDINEHYLVLMIRVIVPCLILKKKLNFSKTCMMTIEF